MPITHAELSPVCSDGCVTELGNVVFTAAADDAFAQEYERDRRVCTSAHEQRLVNAESSSSEPHGAGPAFPTGLHVAGNGRTSSIVQRASSQQYQVSCSDIWQYAHSADSSCRSGGVGMCARRMCPHLQVFFILADLSWEAEDPTLDPEHRLLLCVQAFKDGTIQLQPPVQTDQRLDGLAGHHSGWRKLHDRHGGLYEYKISIRTSGGGDDSISERKQQLWEEQERAHVARAHRSIIGKFLRPPGAWLVMCGEILSGGGFDSASLYVEFALRFQADIWTLKGPDWLLEQHAALEGQFDDDGVCHVRTGAVLQPALARADRRLDPLEFMVGCVCRLQGAHTSAAAPG